ncbi:MAG: hypothetical protein VX527_08760 [Planctomycetota bacterium]|nr:hypothetical protein [Planctomycetota bacterium]
MTTRFQLLMSCVLTVTLCAGMTWLYQDNVTGLEPPSTSHVKPIQYPGLEHVVTFHDDLYSGAKPDGDMGMTSLAALGIRAIICVDGVAPDVEAARQHGIRTIHIPLKYSAPTRMQILDLAVAFSTQREQGRVYVHCHHGMHRSSAAAALILRSLDLASTEELKQRMAIAGTSPHYHGLWDAVDQQTIIQRPDLAAHDTVLPSAVYPRGITAQMTALDEALDRLRLVKDAHWNVPPSHPDLSPAADAGALAETFRFMQLDPDHQYAQLEYRQSLDRALKQALAFEQDLASGMTQATRLEQHLQRVEQSCIDCHADWRK